MERSGYLHQIPNLEMSGILSYLSYMPLWRRQNTFTFTILFILGFYTRARARAHTHTHTHTYLYISVTV